METRQNGRKDRVEHRDVVAHGGGFVRARSIVLRHGWNTTCFQIINPGIEYWFGQSCEAVVGYVSSKGFRVVAGAPVCAEEHLAEVVSDFERESRDLGFSVCYFGAEGRLDLLVEHSTAHSRVLLGAQPVWRPNSWDSIVQNNRDIRSQLNRARNKGVLVTEWPVEKAENNQELSDCLDEWFKLKGLPPLHFVIEPDTLGRLEYRRIFVASVNEKVVGFLILSPIPTRSGWLTEQFPHRPGAPNGTVELMMHTAITTLADEGFEYVTLGLSPLSKRAKIGVFDNPVWLRFALGWMRKHGRRFYNFDGLDFFKAKLAPEYWEPVYAISNEASFSAGSLYAIANAFTHNHPFMAFGHGLSKAIRSESTNFINWVTRR